MKQYKDDLLVSCLQLLLSLPNELVEPEFANIVPALQVQGHVGMGMCVYWYGCTCLSVWRCMLGTCVYAFPYSFGDLWFKPLFQGKNMKIVLVDLIHVLHSTVGSNTTYRQLRTYMYMYMLHV